MMTIIAIIILVAYLAYAYCKVGIPYCLSDTSYTVGKGIFASAMIAICALMWCPMMSATAESWQFLVFLVMAGIMAMAVSPYKDDDMTYKIHYTGTMLASLSMLVLWVTKGCWIVLVVMIVAKILTPLVSCRWLLYLELIMFASAFAYAMIYNS